ncbi:hypothetical protein ACWDYJ_24695 [Streptomyces sp. NPDC003042]
MPNRGREAPALELDVGERAGGEVLLWHSAAIHEAAHGVLALAVGLTRQRLTLAAEDEQPDVGGGYVATGDPERQYPHQHIAVMTLGAGPAQARHLHAAGHTHPELRSCVTEFAAAGDIHQIEQRAAEDWLIDRGQARADAKKILTHPVAATARQALAEEVICWCSAWWVQRSSACPASTAHTAPKAPNVTTSSMPVTAHPGHEAALSDPAHTLSRRN